MIITQCRHQHRSIQIAIAALAGGFRRKHTGMAGRGVERHALGAGWIFGAEWIGGAEARIGERGQQMGAQHFWLAQTNQPPQGSFAVGRGGIDQKTRLGSGKWSDSFGLQT